MYEQTGRYYAFFGPHAVVDAEEVRFLAHWCANHRKALDFGAGLCGPAQVLAHFGLEVLAFEPSPVIASLAMDRLGRGDDRARSITLVEGPTDTFHEPYVADFILMRSVVMLLDPSERAAALRAVKRHAAPGAWLVIDARTAFLPWVEQGSLAEDRRLGHTEYHRRTQYTRGADGATCVHWTIESRRFGRSVESVQEQFVVRADTVEGLEQLLASEGFRVKGLFGAYDLDRPYKEGDALLVAIAQLE
jgi:hypothetical protein